jgi:hypothetical protein
MVCVKLLESFLADFHFFVEQRKLPFFWGVKRILSGLITLNTFPLGALCPSLSGTGQPPIRHVSL